MPTRAARSSSVFLSMLALGMGVALPGAAQPLRDQRVGGTLQDGGVVVTTGQLIRPTGRVVELAGRPVDLVLSPDGRTLYAKDNRGLVVVDVATMAVRQEIGFGDDGSSMTGMVLSRDGARLWVSDCNQAVREFAIGADGLATAGRTITVVGPGGGDSAAFPCGLAVSADESVLYVCLSRNNALGVVTLADGKLARTIPVGVAPYAVVLTDGGSKAWVSCWGGDQPREGDLTANSSGTKAKVDARGVSASGGVVAVDLVKGERTAFVETGLSASGLALTGDGRRLFVANANSDTVSVIDVTKGRVVGAVTTRPSDELPFGSMPCALGLSPDDRRLYVACAGNNALAVVDLSSGLGGAMPTVGWIPTAWYPGAVVCRGDSVFVANIKGVGSRTARKDGSFNSRHHRGAIQSLAAPGATALEGMTRQVLQDGRTPQVLKALERSGRGREVAPVPVPAHPGEPSTIEHVVYIIKENRTYDQVFADLASGDRPRGNGKPELCVYGRDVTANHHAIAEKYVLLDNWYCNGVLSADGHSWATEGNSTPYLERSFGGFKRSYTFGDDPLTYSSSGFVWDHVLAAGLTFRNFGEFDDAKVIAPKGGKDTWAAVWEDWKSGRKEYTFGHSIGIDNLRRHSDPDFPGWNLQISDQIRADIFVAKLAEMERAGSFPHFVTIHMPQDHTMGVSEGGPTPRACVADNDLGVGRVIEALSKSVFWPKMAVFAIEDDPQDGWDHVDGHRSVCLVASPWARRGVVVSEFYNQTSVIHTMERILGIAARNQLYAAAPLMTACFTEVPDYSPYTAVVPAVGFDELSPPKKKPQPKPGDGQAPPSQKSGGEEPKPVPGMASGELDLYALTAKQDLTLPDRVNDREFNRVLWHSAKGVDAPYPAEWSGGHGAGLAELGLMLDDEDDDD